MTLRVVSFKIEVDLLDLLDRVARDKGISRSELIREALVRYLYNNEDRVKVIVTRKMKIYLL